MTKHRIKDLEGEKLDAAVRFALGPDFAPLDDVFQPTESWSDLGPIAERYEVSYMPPHDARKEWEGISGDQASLLLCLGSNPREAMCRVLVARLLGRRASFATGPWVDLMEVDLP